MSTPPGRRVRRRAPTAEERRRILAEEERAAAAVAAGPPVETIGAVITGVLVLLGIVLFLIARRAEPIESFPYQLGVAGGLIGGTLYSIAAFRVLGRYGEPRTGSAFVVRGVILLLAVIGCSFASIGMLTLLNKGLDRSPATVQRALILKKSQEAIGNGRYTGVQAEWAGNVTINFTLPETLFDQIHPRRSYLVVRTRPGAFGWKWIEGVPDVDTPPVTAATPPPAAEAPAPPPVGAAAIPEDNRTDAREIMKRGLDQMRAGARDQAIGEFKRAIELDPYYTFAYWELEKALIAQKDYDTIAEYWSKLIEINPSSRDGWFGRAKTRIAQNNPAGALEDADQACRLSHIQACQMAEGLRTQAQGR
jgi:tetratricopeptide (TPR) repeat protein